MANSRMDGGGAVGTDDTPLALVTELIARWVP